MLKPGSGCSTIFCARAPSRTGEPFRPFDAAGDYLRYVDGKPRFEGVASFLKSRGIELPWGEPGDGEDKLTIYGLGNRKNRYFNEHLKREGVEVFDSSVRFLLALARGRASRRRSSRRAATRLPCSERRASPACSTCASTATTWRSWASRESPRPISLCLPPKRLGAEPSRSIVLEDAISGVEAGRAGRFGLVIGVDRRGAPEALLSGGRRYRGARSGLAGGGGAAWRRAPVTECARALRRDTRAPHRQAAERVPRL